MFPGYFSGYIQKFRIHSKFKIIVIVVITILIDIFSNYRAKIKYTLLIKELLLSMNHFLKIVYLTLLEKCRYSEFLWSVFSHIRTEYGEILRNTEYLSVFSPNAENTEQKNSEYRHFSRRVRNATPRKF